MSERQQSAGRPAALPLYLMRSVHVGRVNHANASATVSARLTSLQPPVIAFIPLIDTARDTSR